MESGTAAWISRWAEIQPERPVIITDTRTITWSAFDADVTRTANALRALGVVRGSRVGCLLHNRPEFLVTFFATQRLGAIFVPLNVRLAAPELRHVLDHSGVNVVVTDESFDDLVATTAPHTSVRWVTAAGRLDTEHDVLDELVAVVSPVRTEIEIAPDDPAVLLYTSGTTGLPKAAVVTHGNIHHQTLNWLLDIGLGHDDRHLVVNPLCFAGGIMGACMNVFHAGATMVLHGSFDAARTLEAIERDAVTWMIAVPTMLQKLSEHPRFDEVDLSSVRMLTGGSPVPLALLERFRDRGVDVLQAFGITEATSGVNLYLRPEDARRKAGSCGQGVLYGEATLRHDDGSEPAVGEVGELLLGGPLVADGYWNDPAATAETFVDGWLRTGDLARRDGDGFFYIVDRKKDLVVSGGLNVYPAEVEPVVATVAGVAEVAVVGLPDPRWGEVVTAVIVLHDGAVLSDEDVIAHCREGLADYKVPKRVEFVDVLPRTASGKVRKRALRDSIADH